MKLIFVYNADSGLFSSIFDLGHKIINPETYQCNLCSLTYGNFTENKKWKNFRNNSDVEMQFMHRDEFEKEYRIKIEYPVVLTFIDELKIGISKNEINKYKSLDELIAGIEKLIEKVYDLNKVKK